MTAQEILVRRAWRTELAQSWGRIMSPSAVAADVRDMEEMEREKAGNLP